MENGPLNYLSLVAIIISVLSLTVAVASAIASWRSANASNKMATAAQLQLNDEKLAKLEIQYQTLLNHSNRDLFESESFISQILESHYFDHSSAYKKYTTEIFRFLFAVWSHFKGNIPTFEFYINQRFNVNDWVNLHASAMIDIIAIYREVDFNFYFYIYNLYKS